MKSSDRYLAFVRFSEEDACYVGFCPDLFPWGGVCHSSSSIDAYRQLVEVIEAHVEQREAAGEPLPEPRTRPMRELDLAA